MKGIRFFLKVIGALVLCTCALTIAWYFLLSPFAGGGLSTKNPEFILNWAGVNSNQAWEVVDASVSPRNITGDHVDYYCIQLERFDVDDRSLREDWRQGPEENALLADAVRSGAKWAHHEGGECFPSPDVANSERVQILFWSMTTQGRRPATAKIILYEPESKKLFYVSYKT